MLITLGRNVDEEVCKGREVLGGAFSKRKNRVLVEEITEVLGERYHCRIGGFDSCRDGTCTIHCLKANIIIILKKVHTAIHIIINQ